MNNQLHNHNESTCKDFEKSVFIKNISHEIRTPMSAILGISKYLIDYTSDNLTPDQKEGLEMIHQSSKRLLTLVTEILDLSRFEAGQMKLKIKPFSLDHLIGELKGMLGSLSKDKKATVFFQVDCSMPPTIVSDEERVYQILWNVIKTGFKYSDGGDIIIHFFLEENRLVIEVKIVDKGASYKFFSILHNSRKLHEKGKQGDLVGSTLGLTLCKKILELMKASFALKAIDEDTCLRFDIPLG